MVVYYNTKIHCSVWWFIITYNSLACLVYQSFKFTFEIKTNLSVCLFITAYNSLDSLVINHSIPFTGLSAGLSQHTISPQVYCHVVDKKSPGLHFKNFRVPGNKTRKIMTEEFFISFC